MRLWLSKLPENLGWEDVINAMMAAHGERGGKHARTALENMLSSSDEDMLNKIADAIEHIGQRVCFTLASSVPVYALRLPHTSRCFVATNRVQAWSRVDLRHVGKDACSRDSHDNSSLVEVRGNPDKLS